MRNKVLWLFIVSSLLFATLAFSQVLPEVADHSNGTIVGSIEWAINQLPASGGTINIPKGTYNIMADEIDVNKSNVNLVCQSNNTFFTVSEGFSGYAMILINGADNFSITGASLNGENETTNQFYGICYNSELTIGKSKFTVRDCDIRNMTLDGILTNNRGHQIIEDNYIAWCSRGVHLSSNCNRAKVTNNAIEHCLGEGVFFCAVIKSADISHNTLRDNQYGIGGISNNWDGENRDRDVIVSSNHFIRNYRYGLGIDYGPVSCIVSNNIFSAVDWIDGGWDAYFGDWRWPINSSRRDIVIGTPGKLPVSDLIISNNRIGNNPINQIVGNHGVINGIRMTNSSGVIISNNWIGGGAQRSAYDGSVHGIELVDDCEDIEISGGFIQNWLNTGVMIRDNAGNKRNVIRFVKFRGVPWQTTMGTAQQKKAIEIEGPNVTDTKIQFCDFVNQSSMDIDDQGIGTVIVP